MRDEKAKANGMGRKNMWWVKLALIPFFSPFFFFFFFFFFGTPSVKKRGAKYDENLLLNAVP